LENSNELNITQWAKSLLFRRFCPLDIPDHTCIAGIGR